MYIMPAHSRLIWTTCLVIIYDTFEIFAIKSREVLQQLNISTVYIVNCPCLTGHHVEEQYFVGSVHPLSECLSKKGILIFQFVPDMIHQFHFHQQYYI